jgi:hypothetical protein
MGKIAVPGIEAPGIVAIIGTIPNPGTLATALIVLVGNVIPGGVRGLNRVYLASPESRGRKDAHASSTRAAAPRTVSIEALAFQLVAAARVPA